MKFIHRIRNHRLRKRMGNLGDGTKLPLDFDYQSPDCIFLGDDVVIGHKAQLYAFKNYAKGNQFELEPRISIGNGVWCTGNLTIWCAGEVSIGCNTMIAKGCTIVDCNHGIDASYDEYIYQPITYSKVKIGDGCWIGTNVIFLPSSGIGNHVIVGAGSVVTKEFPDYCMIAGNPAKIIKVFNREKKEWERYDRD